MTKIIHICLLIFVATWAKASKDVGQLIDDLFLNYDKRFHPGFAENNPVNIKVESAIVDVYDFDEIKHEVTMSMYFRQKWTDPRLSFDASQIKGRESIMLDWEQAKKMWIPDTFIANERSVVAHDFSTPNVFTRISFNGSITRSVKLTVKIGCILYLRWFPFDQNVCSVDFESYGFTMNDIIYTWGRGTNGLPKIWVSDETHQSVRHKITGYRGADYKVTLTSGNYSRAGLALSFKRLSFRYLLDVYFPATAIPIIAFITLVVGPLHFRVLLSTICLGIQIVYAAILMLLTPKVDYKTALDFYVFNSSVTVFNVVLVNFFIYYLLKPKAAPTQIRMRQINGSEDGKGILVDEDGSEETGNPGGSSSSAPVPQRFPNKTTEVLYKLCEKSYLTMPLFFVAFNLIYWPVVLIASSGAPEDFIPIENRYQ